MTLFLLVACMKQVPPSLPLTELTMDAATAKADAELPPPPTPIAPDVNWARPTDEGVLISDEKAAQMVEYAIRYEELRTLYRWELVDSQYKAMASQVQIDALTRENLALREDLEPTWWELNKGPLCFVGGFVVASASVYGLAYVYDTLPR